ncbi:MAG: MBL fold metallo-hydrolase RNA specificity domain-containing protein [Gemmatimonadota bacterium]
MRVSFLGAAGTVTGSRHLVEVDGSRILVDCGMFQGVKSLRRRNWEPFPFDPDSLDAVVLTHAHLDHSGMLPVLVRNGFSGPVYCTEPTAALAPILLADSARLQEEDARHATRKGYSRHKPALPLYTGVEAQAVTPLFEPVHLHREVEIGNAVLSFTSAGHILGAASALVKADSGTLLFSGDLGRPHQLLIPPPETPPEADAVAMESTYGGRRHPGVDVEAALEVVASRTLHRGGVLMVPAFAVGRAQMVLYLLHRLFTSQRIPRVPVFLNSPMAIDVSDLYLRFPTYHRLDPASVKAAFSVATYTRTVEESKGLNRRRGPMVIVAGAGMLSGGRILHHLEAFGGDPRNTVLITGYQAVGTRGADLLAGRRSLKIHGHEVPIRAEVVEIPGLSAHADQKELLDWIGAIPRPPRAVYLIHGDPDQADALRKAIRDRFDFPAQEAEGGHTYLMDPSIPPPGKGKS